MPIDNWFELDSVDFSLVSFQSIVIHDNFLCVVLTTMIKSDKKNERDESKVFVYVSIIHIYIMPICRISHLFRF